MRTTSRPGSVARAATTAPLASDRAAWVRAGGGAGTLRLGSTGLPLLVLVLLAAQAAGQQVPAQPTDYVVDLAGVIDSATAAGLNARLHELEQRTTAQLLVLTVNTTDGVPIADYALAVAERWKLGRKDRDNGVLVVIAVQDRRWRIQVGYGLEPVLTDKLTSEIGRRRFEPHFRAGRYSQGIAEGVGALAAAIAREQGVTLSGQPAAPVELPAAPPGEPRATARGLGCVCWAIALVVLLFVLGGLSRRGRARGFGGGSIWPWLWLLMMSRGGGGRGGWGGGSGGGGFGGLGGGGFGGFGRGSFGGGRGGGFGGGGASGGW